MKIIIIIIIVCFCELAINMVIILQSVLSSIHSLHYAVARDQSSFGEAVRDQHAIVCQTVDSKMPLTSVQSSAVHLMCKKLT